MLATKKNDVTPLFFSFWGAGNLLQSVCMIAKTTSRCPISPPLINVNVSGGDSLNNGRDSSNTLFSLAAARFWLDVKLFTHFIGFLPRGGES